MSLKELEVWFVNNVGWDKMVHCMLSAWLVLSIFILFNASMLWATLSVFILGVLKETYDKFAGGEFGVMDLAADIVGIALSSLILFIK